MSPCGGKCIRVSNHRKEIDGGFDARGEVCGQLGIYGVAFVFSDWQPYTAHVQTSLDRLLVQTVPLALLLLVEALSGLTTARATTTEHATIPSRDGGTVITEVAGGLGSRA